MFIFHADIFDPHEFPEDFNELGAWGEEDLAKLTTFYCNPATSAQGRVFQPNADLNEVRIHGQFLAFKRAMWQIR